MKTQIILKVQMLLVLTMIFSSCLIQTQGQNRTIVNATNSEISDNLDLRVVASIFGDSNTLQDFERRLNDPQRQISNLDLNNDNQVDYLRVIESVQNRTHVVIIQSVLGRDLYQDVATIEVERDRHNQVSIQVVGNTYMYGQNYIYEPVYCFAPVIYESFWVPNYHPYYSNWSWNYYPNNYYAWNPYPVFRYRNNVNNCLNTFYGYNNYNYVNHRSSINAVNMYNSRRSNGYEKQNPNYSFERRNATVANRQELDQIRNTRNLSSRNQVGYSQNRNQSEGFSSQQRTEPQRENSQNRNESPRVASPQRTEAQQVYSQNRGESPRVSSPQRTETQQVYSQNRSESPRVSSPQKTDAQQVYSQNRSESPRVSSPQKTDARQVYTKNRSESPRVSSAQRTEAQQVYSQNRSESRGENSHSRYSNSTENSITSRNGNRRG